jgi:acyl-CoA dehydrogenase
VLGRRRLTAAGGAVARQLDTAAKPDDAALAEVLAIAKANAVAVDAEGRFPIEAITALRQAGLLGALVPKASGGLGQSIQQAAATCYALARCCSSSAMILAMHHIQAACLAAYPGDNVWQRRFLGRVGREGLLLASVTSEVGVGGSMRTSLCAVEPADPGQFTLMKQASTVSYGAYADALLVTARSRPGADAADQVLVVVPTTQGTLTRTGGWNAMGMRGTCSEAFIVTASGGVEQVIPVPFAQISAEIMVPVSHLLWTSLWCGIASDAVMRARLFLRAKMKAKPGPAPDGGRLVRAVEQLQGAEAQVRLALAGWTDGQDASFAAAASINMLKTSVSETCLAVVQDAMLVCGFAGYSNDGPYSLSRHLRDLHSARLMIHNDRIRDSTARLLMAQTPQLGIG